MTGSSRFAANLFYVRADAGAEGGLKPLQEWFDKYEGPEGGDRLNYLSVGPELYPEIATRLGEAGMNKPTGGFRRLIIGSVTEAVMRYAKVPVIAVPPHSATSSSMRTIVCPVIGESSIEALTFAAQIAPPNTTIR